MDDKQKLAIEVKSADGKVEVIAGRKTIELHDESFETFLTCSAPDFFDYLEKFRNSATVFYTPATVVAFAGDVSYNKTPIAHLKMEQSKYLSEVMAVANKKISLDSAESFIRVINNFSDMTATRDLLKMLEDFSIRKVTAIDRKRDQQGNYKFLVQRQAAQDDVVWPKAIKFDVPIWELNEGTVSVTLNITFSYVEVEGEFRAFFEFWNPDLDSVINRAANSIIKEMADGCGIRSFIGNLNITKLTDAWRHLETKEI